MKFAQCVFIALCSALLYSLAQGQDIGLPTAGMRVSSYPTFQNVKSIKSVLPFSFSNGTRFYLWGGNKLLLSKDTPDAVPTELWASPSPTDFIQSINFDERRSSVLFCTNERTLWTYSWPNGGATQIAFDPATQTAPLLGCVYDSARDNLWFIAGGIAVSRSPITSSQSDTIAFTSSVPLTGVTSIVLDTQNGLVLWTYGTAQVQMTPLSNSNLDPSFISSQSLGIGAILSSAYDPVQRVVYLGTDLGIGIEVVTSPSLTFNRYFILPNMQYSSITTDPSHGTSFWMGFQNTTGTQFAVRVNADRFSPFSAVSVTGSDRLGPAAIVNDLNSLWTPFFSNVGSLFAKIQLTDCGLYVCQQCLTNDPQYCGVCSSGQVCTLSSACSANWQTSGTISCPVAGAVVPRSGSTDGGDVITITGQFLDNNELLDVAQTQCTFGSAGPVTATNVAATFIQCRSPSSSVAGQVTLTVSYKGSTWGSPLNFTYIKCSDFTGCDTCTRNLGCGWCMSSGECTASSSCSVLSTWSTVCPSILGVSPVQSSIRGNVNVQLDVIPQLTNELQYSCDFGFGSGAVVPASFISSTRLSCTTPTISASTWTSMQSSANVTQGAYLTSVAVLQAGKYITSTALKTFAIYDCPTQSKHCEGCNGVANFVFPECEFCYDSGVTSCQYSDASCTDSDGTCPNIESLNPPSMLQGDSGVTSVDLTGLFSFTGSTPITNLVCMWDVDTTATAGDAETASGITATSITCPIPASLPLGTHTVSIWRDEGSGSYSRITSNADFLVYDCSAAGPCSACVSDLKPKCYWCSASGSLSCRPIADVSCSANQIIDSLLCPALTSVTPDAEEVAGGTQLTLSGSNMKLQSYSNIKCQFISDEDNSVQSVTAIVLENDLLRCTAPAVSNAANYHVDVLVGTVAHTNKIPFNYYKCSAEPSCADCLVPRNTRCTWCLGACATQCAVPTPVTCPRINTTDPTESYNKGGQNVRVFGGPFVSSNSLTYTCNFGGELGVVTTVTDTYIDCLTPTRSGFASFEGNVDLTVLANGAPYTEEPFAFNFFGCPILPSATACGSECTARAGCGWCVSQSTCTVDFMCNSGEDFFIDKCYNVSVTPNIIRAGSNQTINVQFNQPLPFTFTPDPFFGTNPAKRSIFQTSSTDPQISCRFGSANVPAVPNLSNNPDSFTCLSPVILQEGSLPFTVLWNGNPLVESVNFEITNCGGYSTDCSQCIQRPYCNWCFESNTCSEADICAADKWGGATCPSIIETDPEARAGLIAGVVIGGVVLIGGAIFLVLLLRYRKKKRQGLVVDFKEPDYTEVAFKNEVTLQYKITAKDDYEELENILMNRDRTFLKAVAAVTSATEDDAVSRSLTFIAHKRKVASDMIQYFASDEVMKAKSENTIFRQDSLSSKMFKYYSKIVGTRYLFFMLARVINELNELAETAEAAENKDLSSVGSSNNLLSNPDPMSQGANDLTASESGNKRKSAKKKSVIVYEGTEINRASASLLNFDMELDPVLLENKEVDTEANVYQLELACQKILTVIINNENKVPREFREIFVRIENAIKLKFGNETAAYKAVGGFLFLRFICPAITVPQYYGLISEIPNKKCQRQLILIAKVLQNMANLATLSHKETFMKDLEGFMSKNQPKFVDLYQNLLNPEKLPDARARLQIEVPENARLNSLAYMHQHIHRSERKLRANFEHLAEQDADKAREMNKLLDEIMQNYGEPPKKKE